MKYSEEEIMNAVLRTAGSTEMYYAAIGIVALAFRALDQEAVPQQSSVQGQLPLEQVEQKEDLFRNVKFSKSLNGRIHNAIRDAANTTKIFSGVPYGFLTVQEVYRASRHLKKIRSLGRKCVDELITLFITKGLLETNSPTQTTTS